MSWTWNGTTSRVSATITAYDSGSWTLAAKVLAQSLGEASSGKVIQITNGAAAVQTLAKDPGGAWDTWQTFATTAENVGSSQPWANPKWTWLWMVSVYDESLAAGSRMKLWIGSEFATMNNVTEAVTSAAGARSTGGTTANIGNTSGPTETWDGSIEDAIFDTVAWPDAQVHAFHEGWLPYNVSTLRFWIPFKEARLATTSAPIQAGGTAVTWTSAGMVMGPLAPRAGYRRKRLISMTAARR